MDAPHDAAQNAAAPHMLEPRARLQRLVDLDLDISDDIPTALERDRLRGSLRGPWILIVGFALLIGMGTLLLKLPVMAAAGATITWSDAFFTAASAITVTGLTVRNTALDFSFAGQAALLFLIQVGGVGFVTSSVLLFRLVRRRITLNTRFLVQQDVGAGQLGGVLRLALYVLYIAAIIEAIGALLLWLRWRTLLPDGQAAWLALFHAISSYCNAGFDLFGATELGPLYGFQGDGYTIFVLCLLIILGGFGVTIYYDLWTYRRDRLLSLNTRFALLFTVLLSIGGLVFFLIDPQLHSNAVPDLDAGQRFWVSLFTSAGRTAGITIIPIERLTDATHLVLMVLMFIGASPASMAGGISINTVAVLLTAARGTARGADPTIMGRTLPGETVSKAVAIITVSTLVVVATTLIMTLYYQTSIFPLSFEVVSAFSSAGFTLGVTPTLDDFGRLLIAFTMFWGRLGPLTIVVALAQREQPALVHYPKESVILG